MVLTPEIDCGLEICLSIILEYTLHHLIAALTILLLRHCISDSKLKCMSVACKLFSHLVQLGTLEGSPQRTCFSCHVQVCTRFRGIDTMGPHFVVRRQRSLCLLAPFRSLADRKPYPVNVLTRWGCGSRKDSPVCSRLHVLVLRPPIGGYVGQRNLTRGGSFFLSADDRAISISAIDENAPPARGRGLQSHHICCLERFAI